MHENLKKRVMVSATVKENLTTDRATGPVTFTATAADIVFAFAPAVPISVTRFGVLAKTLIDVGAGMVLTLSKTAVLTDLSAPTAIATLSTGIVDIAANKGVYRDVVTDVAATQVAGLGGHTDLVNVKPNGPGDINPGEAVTVTLTDVADTAGTGYVWIEYIEYPLAGSRVANYTRVTS